MSEEKKKPLQSEWVPNVLREARDKYSPETNAYHLDYHSFSDAKWEFSPAPTAVTFSWPGRNDWALRITKDGIVANPDMPIDEAAAAVLKALEPMIKALK